MTLTLKKKNWWKNNIISYRPTLYFIFHFIPYFILFLMSKIFLHISILFCIDYNLLFIVLYLTFCIGHLYLELPPLQYCMRFTKTFFLQRTHFFCPNVLIRNINHWLSISRPFLYKAIIIHRNENFDAYNMCLLDQGRTCSYKSLAWLSSQYTVKRSWPFSLNICSSRPMEAICYRVSHLVTYLIWFCYRKDAYCLLVYFISHFSGRN